MKNIIKKIKVRNNVAVAAHFRSSWVEENKKHVETPRKRKYKKINLED